MSDESDARLSEIEARRKAAETAAGIPWRRDDDDGVPIVVGPLGPHRQSQNVICEVNGIPEEGVPTAEFIAHAPEDIDWLISEVRRLRAENEEMKAERNDPYSPRYMIHERDEHETPRMATHSLWFTAMIVAVCGLIVAVCGLIAEPIPCLAGLRMDADNKLINAILRGPGKIVILRHAASVKVHSLADAPRVEEQIVLRDGESATFTPEGDSPVAETEPVNVAVLRL